MRSVVSIIGLQVQLALCVLSISFSARCFGNQKQSTSLPDDSMQLGYHTNPEPVAQIMKYKVSLALHAVTSYYTCMKLHYVLYLCGLHVCLIVE